VTTNPTRPTPVGVDALLSDGSVATVRPLRPADRQALLDLHRQASDRNRWLRFFSAGLAPAEQYAQHLIEGGDGHLAVVAERDGYLLGVASAEPLPDREAEVALFVADRLHHTGVGTLLLEHLATAARGAGLQRFSALVLAENRPMLNVFLHAGFEVQLDQIVDGEVGVHLDLRGTRPLAAAVAERERRAVTASIASVLAPVSVVVIGAGRNEGGAGRNGGETGSNEGEAGRAVLHNLNAKGFTGKAAAVNPRAVPGELIAGERVYRSLAEVPWVPDLAVIAVPAPAVAAVLEECGLAGVRAAVVLSAGFAEVENADGQAELVRIAHRHGIRLVGPNCLGVLNTDPAVRLDATFARSTPSAGEHGGVGLATQSGALGVSVLDAAGQRGIGISGFVSLGNKADVSGNDMLLYWAGDPPTSVIALYLESVGNPRRFRRIAAETARIKPIVALRSGRSAAGARAGASHTAAAATPDASTKALFREAGVIAAESTEELVDISMLLSTQPVPAGRRVVIVGNAGGPGALAADAAHDAGAVVPELSAETVTRLKTVAGSVAGLNPVDLGAGAIPADYAAAIGVLRASGEADSLVVIHVATGAGPTNAVIQAIEQAELDGGRKVPGTEGFAPLATAAVMIGAPAPRAGVVPWYGFAESAARAVAKAADLGVWRAGSGTALPGPTEVPIPPGVDRTAVAAFLESAPRSAEGWLQGAAAAQLLQLIGVPVCATVPARGVVATVDAAASIDGPVVVKSGAAGLTHKSERGAVVVGVRRAEEVISAAERVIAATGSDELLVQPVVPAGQELLLGLSLPAGGVPIVLVAAGGVHEEVLADRVLRTLPLAPGGAEEMVDELRCAPLLHGHRGSPALDRAAVAEMLIRIAALDVIAPQIRELDINPLVVGEHGVIALDAKVRIATPGEPSRRRDPVTDDYQRQLG
jgi:acyl-CoA synthetase (NDP forming)/GNAT superfamily N-acetyltransferase